MNLTNRCTNRCSFCVRQMTDGLGGADNLWLEKEPSVEEVMKELERQWAYEYEELIFCGYGEPSIRLNDVLEISRRVKDKADIKIRMNTNGLADRIHGKRTAPMLEGLIDRVSVSLNEADAESYNELCLPEFGVSSFDSILAYIKDVKSFVQETTVSVVGCIPADHIERCRQIASELGVGFKVR